MNYPPTATAIEYGLKSLKDALSSVEKYAMMNDAEKSAQAAGGNYANAATLQGVGIGLMRAENCLRVEIETLEIRLRAVQAYWEGQPK